MSDLLIFSNGLCTAMSDGGSPRPHMSLTPTDDITQSVIERALGLPQVLHLVVSYQGTLKSSMGVAANELDQQDVP